MTKDNIYNWEKESEDVTLKDKRLKQRLVKIKKIFRLLLASLFF